MSQALIELLIEDHNRIRELHAQLKRACQQTSPDDEKCLTQFRALKAHILAHAKAEELILYALVESPLEPTGVELQHFAYEGYEEHDLIDFLMKEMIQAEEVTLQWKAQVNVLGEMLERHFDDEEKTFFPQISQSLDSVEWADLAEEYVKERDLIYAKKSGLRGNLSIASSALHTH